ncbi:MAG: hydrogenase maturation protease [Candidatus Desulfacyla sp.]
MKTPAKRHPSPRKGLLVIGIGNAFREDDGIGPYVVRQLLQRGLSGVTAIVHPGDGGALISLWEGWDKVVIVDAMTSGGSPGAIRSFHAHKEAIPAAWFRGSTHQFHVGEAVELARTLGRLPRFVMVYGIEGKTFSPGQGLTPEVARAGDRVAEEIAEMGIRHERPYDTVMK